MTPRFLAHPRGVKGPERTPSATGPNNLVPATWVSRRKIISGRESYLLSQSATWEGLTTSNRSWKPLNSG
jgi:hypothetical protein